MFPLQLYYEQGGYSTVDYTVRQLGGSVWFQGRDQTINVYWNRKHHLAYSKISAWPKVLVSTRTAAESWERTAFWWPCEQCVNAGTKLKTVCQPLEAEIAWCGTLHFHPTKQGFFLGRHCPDLGHQSLSKACTFLWVWWEEQTGSFSRGATGRSQASTPVFASLHTN